MSEHFCMHPQCEDGWLRDPDDPNDPGHACHVCTPQPQQPETPPKGKADEVATLTQSPQPATTRGDGGEGRYSEGIMSDGACILYDGQPVPIEDVVALLNAPQSGKKEDGWLPVETAPKDGSEFVTCNMRQGGVKALVHWNRLHGYWKSKGDFIHMQATHWAPLPPTPSSPPSKAETP